MEMQKAETIQILIESCENCKLHQWNTRHDEKRYNLLYTQISEAIKGISYKNYEFVVSRKANPKLGAFEIYFVAPKELKLVYSKLYTSLFPLPDCIPQRLITFLNQYFEGVNVDKFAETKERRFVE